MHTLIAHDKYVADSVEGLVEEGWVNAPILHSSNGLGQAWPRTRRISGLSISLKLIGCAGTTHSRVVLPICGHIGQPYIFAHEAMLSLCNFGIVPNPLVVYL